MPTKREHTSTSQCFLCRTKESRRDFVHGRICQWRPVDERQDDRKTKLGHKAEGRREEHGFVSAQYLKIHPGRPASPNTAVYGAYRSFP